MGLDTVSGREAQETTAMLLLLPQLVNQFLKPNVSMYQERPVPQLPVKSQNKFAMMWTVKFAFQFQRRNVSQYNAHPVSPPTSKYANQSQKKNVTPSQNNNVKLSKRKSVLPSQKLTASLNHVKNVFLFQTKLARLYQSRSALNSLPRNVAMSQERSVNQLSQ